MASAKERPPIYTNSIEIDFGQRFSVTALAVHKWFRSIKVPPENVVGFGFIRQANRRVFVVKFASELLQQEFLDRYEGNQTIATEAGPVEATIGIPSIRATSVRIYDIPFEATRADIQEALGKYGSITRIKFNKCGGTEIPEYYNVLDGTATIGMTLKHHIPSAVTIRGAHVLVHYPGQPKTCFACGDVGHVTNECPQKTKSANNDKFPGKWAEPPPASSDTQDKQ